VRRPSLFAGLAALGLGATLAPGAVIAQETQVLFTGTFLVTAASKTCENMVGDTRAMYFANILWGIGKPGFVLVNPNGSVVIAPKTKAFKSSGDYDLTQVDRWTGIATWSSTYSDLKFSPSKIDAKTTQVTITGKLTKLNYTDSCTVTFRAVGLRNP
jgi:hypothetical protein